MHCQLRTSAKTWRHGVYRPMRMLLWGEECKRHPVQYLLFNRAKAQQQCTHLSVQTASCLSHAPLFRQACQLVSCTWRCLSRLYKLFSQFFIPHHSYFVATETTTNCRNVMRGYAINHVIPGFTSGPSIIWRHFRRVVVTHSTINLSRDFSWRLDWSLHG